MSKPLRMLGIGVVVVVGLSGFARAGRPGAGGEAFQPDPATVQRFGAGYCYPQAGQVDALQIAAARVAHLDAHVVELR